MEHKLTAFMSLILLVLLTGCGDQKILEKIGFTQTTSYDLLPEGNLKIAVTIPKADPEANVSREVLSTTAQSSKEAKISFSRQTHLILVSGQLRNTLFGLSLAKSGLWNHIDTLIRDPSISPRVKVTVVNGDAESILEKNYKQHPRTGKYVDLLLEKETHFQTLPKVTIYDFARDYYDDGIDPVAPIIKDIGDSVIVDGVALFRDDKYIAKVDPNDSLIFSFLRGDFKQGQININLAGTDESRETVMFSSIVSSRKVDVKQAADKKSIVNIEVNVKGSILEYIGDLKLSNDSDRRKLERNMSENLSGRGNQMVQFMQEKKVDSVGIGMYVRNSMSYASWKNTDWREEFPHIQINCHIHVKIKDYGKFR